MGTERQDELGRRLHDLRGRLLDLDKNDEMSIDLSRSDIEALCDCIDLALAVRLITVDCR